MSSSQNTNYNDRFSMFTLLVLYTLQGIPMGLSGSIPLLLKERNVSFEGLALFSLVSIPFSLKLLWAPLVDSLYFKQLGRRKTWLVPVQLLCGFVMIAGAGHINNWMVSGPESSPDVQLLTGYFLFLYFLMATQDIAVDGWAITMLSKENRGYAAACNSIGQSLGYFMSNQGFIALSDENWCRKYLGFSDGKVFVNLTEFMVFWGIFFIIVTLLVWAFKPEIPLTDDEEQPLGLIDTYKQVISLFKLKSIQSLCFVLFTCKIAFSPADSVFSFKLQEYGMPKSEIATISPFLLVIGLFLPAIISQKVSSKPLEIFLMGIPLKLFTSALTWFVFQYAVKSYSDNGSPSVYFYASLIVVLVFHEIAGTLVFISMMSFFNKISDPAMGGTYMTLLNTIANLGSKWPNSSALWLLPKLTHTECRVAGDVLYSHCIHTKKQCRDQGGVCVTTFDGFTYESALCISIGIVWLFLLRGFIYNLQGLGHKEWCVSTDENKVSDNFKYKSVRANDEDKIDKIE